MLVKLSDLLSYTLYEGEEKRVSLERELAMMQVFVELERINRGGSLEAIIVVEGGAQNKTISPLLLLSLMQSCLEAAGKNESVEYFIRIAIEPEILQFRLTAAGTKGKVFHEESWDNIVNTVREKMTVFAQESFRLQPETQSHTFNLAILLGTYRNKPDGVDWQNEKTGDYANS
jgi:hypothetical protein